jgi:broad specificity phosphatase PhoE
MGKTTLHLVRHAQGYHNLNEANHALPDPDLTPLGVQQCTTLSSTFPHPCRITHLVSSPLRRTLYTALLSFPSYLQHHKKVIALPELQETSDLPCDIGSSHAALSKEFSEGRFAGCVDLGLVTEDWNSKEGKWSPASSAIDRRALDARRWLRDLGKGEAEKDVDVDIVVVTHGGFLHYLTEDWEGAERGTGSGWENTEFRSYEFVEGGEKASLRETRESRERRRGTERGLTEDEQRELRASREREWRDSGFQKDG